MSKKIKNKEGGGSEIFGQKLVRNHAGNHGKSCAEKRLERKSAMAMAMAMEERGKKLVCNAFFFTPSFSFGASSH